MTLSQGEDEALEEKSVPESADLGTDPMEVLRNFKALPEDCILLLEDIHPYLESHNHQVVRWVREICRLPEKPFKLLVLSTPSPALPEDLQKEVPTIDVPLPGVEDLAKVARQVAGIYGVDFDESQELLEAARGLTVMEAKLAYAQAALDCNALNSSCVPRVMAEKSRVIRQSGVLEYYDTQIGLEAVGGLDHLKTWLGRRGRAFGAAAKKFGLDAPKGALLLGVQGCGKSLVAKSIASEWRFPLVRFDMSAVFGGIVGQSEGNMRLALKVAQALAPCVLWIDEIEKGLSGLGSSDRSDGGTTARVVGSLLTWMQEKTEPVFVVATANRIDMLPPELLRKGRFDEIFFVDLPNAAVREDILAIHLKKKGRRPEDFDLAGLAAASRGFSGAELEEAVKEGLFQAFDEVAELADRHVLSALSSTWPLSKTMGSTIRDLRAWARVRAHLASSYEPEDLPEINDAKVPRLAQESRNLFVPEPRK
jgi:hypothetical protein